MLLKWLQSHWFAYTFIRGFVIATLVAIVLALVGLKFLAAPGQDAPSAFVQILGVSYWILFFVMSMIVYTNSRYEDLRRSFQHASRLFGHAVIVGAPTAVMTFVKSAIRRVPH